ncbi:glycosyltransferase family 2 protein [Shewanella frigidimarina]|uniref:glycosyltransferase family 2 protein n=1 Tax=Shewanella frigidimarina TaxID=56812 RepID=UPI000F4D7D95|nr:glycosyltransferase family 2 protein [Shewanella frigidimarina]RPA38332.1 glycosyltransferase [Shewanella frigidimarina]
MTTLSVIIPTTVKDSKLLERAIDSVLTNRELDIEVVIVNDNSDTFLLAENFLQKYSSNNISIYQNKGVKGAGGARNFGVKQASGELITFLDDDDFLLPGRLECMVNRFNQPDDNIVLVSTGRVYEYNNFERIEVVRKQIFGRLKLHDIFIHNQIDIGFMIKKSTFTALNGFDTTFKNLEDWDFIIRCLSLGDAYKIKSHSYIVKNDDNPNRVSNNDYLGLKQLASKHKNHFGDKWFYKIKTQELRSSGALSLIKSFSLSYKLKSLYPMKNYIATLVRK